MLDITKKVDKRKRLEMVDFLESHERYSTMNTWNRGTSYAHNVKIHGLGMSHGAADVAYEELYDEYSEAYDELNWLKQVFAEEYHYSYQIGFNGRSSGYLVLFQGGRDPTDHKSECHYCGTVNFSEVCNKIGKCGKCGKEGLLNLKKRRYTTYTTGRGTHEEEDFESWQIENLREQVNFIQKFDSAVQGMITYFVAYCEDIAASKKVA